MGKWACIMCGSGYDLTIEKLELESTKATDEREKERILAELDNIKGLIPEIELKVSIVSLNAQDKFNGINPTRYR